MKHRTIMIAILVLLCAGIPIRADEWPLWRGDPTLRGVAGGELPDKPARRWSVTLGESIRSSPVIAEGRVYVGCDDGQLYCRDLVTGKPIWSAAAGSAISAPPTVIDGVVYVGSDDGVLHAIGAADGQPLWQHRSEQRIAGAVNYHRQGEQTWLVFGSYDGQLYCLDAATGEERWRYTTENYINGTPAVIDGMACFGGCDQFVHGVSLVDGMPLVKVDAGSYIAASVAVTDGRAFVGHMAGQFHALSLSDEAILWTYDRKRTPFFSSPAVGEHSVLVGDRDRVLWSLRRSDGKVQWSVRAAAAFDSSPVIAGSKVLAVTTDGRVMLLALSDGRPIWRFELGQSLETSPAVSNGWFVIGTDAGDLHAFASSGDR